MATELRDLCDRVESLHRRMDRFYEWASSLQVEARNTNQRLWALEKAASEKAEAGDLLSLQPRSSNEQEEEIRLLARLEALNKK